MKRIFILTVVLLTSTIAVFASSGLTLSKSQQNRLNNLIKQLKVPPWDYRLTVNSTGVLLREYEPTVVTGTWETITQEKVIEKVVIVEKPVIVEKIIEKPMSVCVDLSKANPSYTTWGRYTNETVEKIRMEIEEMKIRNQMFWCP